jgi:predicted nucleotidyltransferase
MVNIMKSGQASQTAIRVLEKWVTTSKLSDVGAFYVFGSAINFEGNRFDRKTSDLDILVILSSSHLDPLARVKVAEVLLAKLPALETKLLQALSRESAAKPMVSTLLTTQEEVKLNIHKTTSDGFFSRSDFQRINSKEKKPFREFLPVDKSLRTPNKTTRPGI